MGTSNSNLLGGKCTWTVGLVCALFLVVDTMSTERQPDNAALLYYQAFLMCPDSDDLPQEVGSVLTSPSGADVAELRKFSEKYQNVIRLLETASKLPHCNLAVARSPRAMSTAVRGTLAYRMRVASLLIAANVRVLAADGDYRRALSQCLMLRRIAWHFGDDPPFHFEPVFLLTVGTTSLRCVRSVLEVMPRDQETLRWLSEQLTEAPRISDVLPRRLRQSYDVWLRTVRADGPAVLTNLREKLAEKSGNVTQKEAALGLTDNELFELVREQYEKFLDAATDAMGTGISYVQSRGRLETLKSQYTDQAEDNPAIVFALQVAADSLVSYYDLQVLDTSLCNAYEAAIELYLHKATTGRLPETLPDGLPKDPFTGGEFKYEVTDDGFVLGRPYDYVGGVFKELRFRVSWN